MRQGEQRRGSPAIAIQDGSECSGIRGQDKDQLLGIEAGIHGASPREEIKRRSDGRHSKPGSLPASGEAMTEATDALAPGIDTRGLKRGSMLGQTPPPLQARAAAHLS